MILLIIILSFLSLPAQAWVHVGTAKKIDSGEVIYIEKHQITDNEDGYNKLIVTNYTDPNGKTFATIESDFSKDLYLPDVVFKDFRFNTVETQIYDKSKSLVTLTKMQNQSMVAEEKISVKGVMVGGQGFNNFIKTHFKLAAGEKLKLQFLALAKMDSFSFEITPLLQSDKRTKTFTMKLENFLFRIFAQSIEVQYESDSQDLIEYRGISNIMDNNNSPQSVSIKYTREPQ